MSLEDQAPDCGVDAAPPCVEQGVIAALGMILLETEVVV